VKIIATETSKKNLIFLEAILIKTMDSSMNSQNEGPDRILKVFKH
jgi:hypothetical protein